MEMVLLGAVIAGWTGVAVGTAMCAAGLAKHGSERSVDEVLDEVRAQAAWTVRDERTREANGLNDIAIGAVTLGTSLAIAMGAGVLDTGAARLGAALGLTAGVLAVCGGLVIAWLAAQAPRRGDGA